MAGLLGGVLPWAYSQGDRLKRHFSGLLSDPMGSMEQTAGLLMDKHREHQALQAQAFADPQRPFKVTNQKALGGMIDQMMTGPMGFAPAGMTSRIDFTSGKYAPDITMDEMRAVMHVPTVEKMRIAMDAAGEDVFEKMVQAQFKAYRPKTPDQEAMFVESIANQIVAKLRR